MGRDTIAGLIAGILQKYTKKEGLDSRGNDNKKPEDNHSFVEIALADDEGPADDLTKTTDTDEVTDDSSRPVTALRRTCDSAGAGASSRLSHKSWEAFNHQEEMTQASHTMSRNIVVTERNGETTDNNLDSVESVNLPDSLNEFEGEEYQSPNLFREDSLGVPQTKLLQLESHQDLDSLQFQVSPVPNKTSDKSPLDSLIDIDSDEAKLKAAEFFDSITSINKTKNANENYSVKRRIIPYGDNSLSSGTSAFTSQDVSFDSKESSSSPSDVDRAMARQIVNPVQDGNTLYPDVTLAIHPIRTPPTPHNIPIHPLSRRYQMDQSGTQQQKRINNMSHYMGDTKPQNELYDTTNSTDFHPVTRNNYSTIQTSNPVVEVASEYDDKTSEPNQTKETQLPKSQTIRSATEKLKWKFLGW